MERIVVWSGQDVYDILEIPDHGSPLSYINMNEIREIFGQEAEVVRVGNSNRYEIRVDKVQAHA